MRHAWRLAAWDTPLWASPNRGATRYNAESDGPVQYWSPHPLGPWAEHLRAHGIHTVQRLRQLRVRAWVARLAEPAQLGFDEAPAYGLAPEDLVADDHTACQQLGARVLADGQPAALEVPSAALPATRNLVALGARVASPFGLAPIGEVDVPTAVIADAAHALETLLGWVCHVGQPHPELAAWRRAVSMPMPSACELGAHEHVLQLLGDA